MVLFQARLLAVGMVAFRTSHYTCIFGPSLINTSSTEVVFARELDWLREHVQTYGTDELLLKRVFPIFCHSHLLAFSLLKAQITQVVFVVLIKHCDLHYLYWLRGHSQKRDQPWRDRGMTVISHSVALVHLFDVTLAIVAVTDATFMTPISPVTKLGQDFTKTTAQTSEEVYTCKSRPELAGERV